MCLCEVHSSIVVVRAEKSSKRRICNMAALPRSSERAASELPSSHGLVPFQATVRPLFVSRSTNCQLHIIHSYHCCLRDVWYERLDVCPRCDFIFTKTICHRVHWRHYRGFRKA